MQKHISIIFGEAEWGALVRAGGAAIGATNMFEDLVAAPEIPLVISDAIVGIGLASRKGLGRAKHVEIGTLWVQDGLRERRIRVGKIPTANNLAYVGTKALSASSGVCWRLGALNPEAVARAWRWTSTVCWR